MTIYLPPNIATFASTHETSREIALAIFETAVEGDEERVWLEPTDEEVEQIMRRAWSYADKGEDTLIWGVTTFKNGAVKLTTAFDKADPHAICAKWVRRFGLGFHPDTRGADYVPPLSAEEIAEYDKDMGDLFDVAADPYECGMMAMADYGLLSDEEAAQWSRKTK